MSIPAASHDGRSHRLLLSEIAIRLRKEYAELLKNPPPSRMMSAADSSPAAISLRTRPRARRPHAPGPRRPPVYRFSDPPLGTTHRRPRRRSGFARMFVLVLFLHVMVIGGIVITELVESSIIWRAIGCAVAVWMVLRCMAAISRRITPPRRTTSRVSGRNCDRDIWL